MPMQNYWLSLYGLYTISIHTAIIGPARSIIVTMLTFYTLKMTVLVQLTSFFTRTVDIEVDLFAVLLADFSSARQVTETQVSHKKPRLILATSII